MSEPSPSKSSPSTPTASAETLLAELIAKVFELETRVNILVALAEQAAEMIAGFQQQVMGNPLAAALAAREHR